MCGIAALLTLRGTASIEAMQAMLTAVRHRGPDGEGMVAFAGEALAAEVLATDETPDACLVGGLPYSPGRRTVTVAPALVLGHRRLSIVDLSAAGHQPMCSADGRFWIVYNGEIYNHVELRDELAGLGHRFVSHSDTEVMLAAWQQWGRACLARFNGMFAFVLVDRAARRLYAVRDRFGVKPLYYWHSPAGLLAFASEIKQFSPLPGWQPRVNSQRAYDFLNWALQDHTDETLFAGVSQLRNGELLEVDLHTRGAEPALVPQRWYELAAAPFDGNFPQAASRLRELLEDSVRLRLRSDVPVGSCLSGGLDSSAIVCLMSALLSREGTAAQMTFSARAAAARFDEGRFIQEVVRATGAHGHEVQPGADELFEVADVLAWHQDEPYGSTSIFAQWCVFRLAAGNGVKVMLDGQGADEQLAGYHSYFGARLASLLQRMRWLRFARELAQIRRLHRHSVAWSMQQTANHLLPESLRDPLRRVVGKTGAAPDWLDMAALGAAPANPFLPAPRGRPVQDLSRAQLTRTNLQMLLHWEDRNSMAHGVEARLPFLDWRLVEFVLGLPDDFKVADATTKRVLRTAMEGVLPEPVRNRVDKLGFATPEEIWVRESHPKAFRAALRQAVDTSGGILNPRALAILDAMIDGRVPFHALPWRMIAFGTWMRRFGVSLP